MSVREPSGTGTGSAGRGMPASGGATWRKRPALGCSRLREHAARAELRVLDELVDRVHGRDAGVVRRELGDPVVAVAGAERGREVGADLLLRRVVGLVREPLLAAEAPAQVRVELRLDRADRHPAAVAARVGVVAGVAAGQNVVAGPGLLPGCEKLVDVERGQLEHALGDAHVEVLALARALAAQQRREDRERRVHAARGAVGHRGARDRRPAVAAPAARVQEAADREVVDVVARRTATRGRSGRSRSSSRR